MSSPAPTSRNSESTFLMSPSFMPVASLPSEKVPAPPSPKSMFASGSRTRSFLNFSTASMRPSMDGPRSITRGLYPSDASSSAANRPAGPAPITTGLPPRASSPCTGGRMAAASASSSTAERFLFRPSFSFFPVTKSTVYTYCICGFFLESMDFRRISHSEISVSRI